MVNAGAVGLAQHHTIVVALVPRLEIDPAGPVPPGLRQTQHVAIEMDRAVEIGHPQLCVTRPQHTRQSHCHPSLFFKDARRV
jgi:hypothetical protein